jgi:hypothetical protein
MNKTVATAYFTSGFLPLCTGVFKFPQIDWMFVEPFVDEVGFGTNLLE